MSELPILVVFDIDETLLQYMNNNAHHYLDEISVEDRKTIQQSKIEYEDIKTKNIKTNMYSSQCVLFRPYLSEFLEMVKNNKRLHIAIWTYAERDYGIKIAEMITRHFGFKENPFVFVYGEEDIEDHDHPKSMEQIWRDHPKYNKFNTFLIDDRFGNVKHNINRENAVLCQGFAPFSETKARQPLTPNSLERSVNDTMLKDVMDILNKSFRDMGGCSPAECMEAFKMESIFKLSLIRRKKMEEYIQEIDGIKMVALGNVSEATSHHKGGKKIKHIKKISIKKTKKNKRKLNKLNKTRTKTRSRTHK